MILDSARHWKCLGNCRDLCMSKFSQSHGQKKRSIGHGQWNLKKCHRGSSTSAQPLEAGTEFPSCFTFFGDSQVWRHWKKHGTSAGRAPCCEETQGKHGKAKENRCNVSFDTSLLVRKNENSTCKGHDCSKFNLRHVRHSWKIYSIYVPKQFIHISLFLFCCFTHIYKSSPQVWLKTILRWKPMVYQPKLNSVLVKWIHLIARFASRWKRWHGTILRSHTMVLFLVRIKGCFLLFDEDPLQGYSKFRKFDNNSSTETS